MMQVNSFISIKVKNQEILIILITTYTCIDDQKYEYESTHHGRGKNLVATLHSIPLFAITPSVWLKPVAIKQERGNSHQKFDFNGKAFIINISIRGIERLIPFHHQQKTNKAQPQQYRSSWISDVRSIIFGLRFLQEE